MSAWHDRVGDLTLFEALTGEAFDRQNGNIAGNLTKIFQKSQMPRGLPRGGGMGGFGIDRYIRTDSQRKFQMFTLFSGRHIGAHLICTNMAFPYCAL